MLLSLISVIVIICCFVATITAVAENKLKLKTVVKEGKLLNQYGMIQTHDSATGELDEARDKILARWSRTQHGGIIDQLNCGARSLDYRPYLSKDGTLYAHHGPTVIYKPMRETLKELFQWGKENPIGQRICAVAYGAVVTYDDILLLDGRIFCAAD